MEKRTKVYIIAGIIILAWMILILGIIEAPAFVWLALVIVSFVFYLSATGYQFRRRGSLEEVMDDMEDYMESKAEETEMKELEGDPSKKTESEEEEYDFGDDIEIIKK